MVDVFISYSRTDQGLVARLAAAVEREGYDVWWDDELPVHQSYSDVITAKIGRAKAAIVVWSPEAVQSEWVRAEADVARNQKKLIQTAIGEVMPPLPFNQIQFAAIGDWHGEADHPGWCKVKRSLADLVGRQDHDPAPPVRPKPRPHTPVGPAKWPLYTGLAVGAVGLVLVGVFLGGIGGSGRAEPPSVAAPAVATPAAAAPARETVERAPEAAPVRTVVRERYVAAPAEAPNDRTADGQGYGVSGSSDLPAGGIIADSGTRRLTPADIAGLGPMRLRLARNEIFARHGRRFRDPDLVDYFARQPWYRATADEVELSEIELANVALLRRAETARSAGAMR